MSWRVTRYDSKRLREVDGDDEGLLEASEPGDADEVRWIDLAIADDGDPRLVELAAREGLHRLTLEDLGGDRQRAKLEEYDDYLLLTILRVRLADDDGLRVRAVGLILQQGTLLSVRRGVFDPFPAVSRRLANVKAPIRRQGADRLAVTLLDAVIDGYFEVLDQTGEAIETLEGEIIEAERGELPELERLHGLRKRLLALKRAAWPLRELASALERCDSELIQESTRPYIRDLRDHAVYVIDALETQREALVSLNDLYRTIVGQRTNDVMRLLSVIATIFMPLTFLAGIYGMNFKQGMPELEWAYGYPALWGVMILITGCLLVVFSRRGWLA